MTTDDPAAPKQELRNMLDAPKNVYLRPTPDWVVDQKLIDMAAEFVTARLRGPRVLELGVGAQVWTPSLLRQFEFVTSLDASAELLDAMALTLAGTSEGRRWTPVHTYFEDYVPEQRFDTVVATYVLEHVDDPGLVLRRARTLWLRPGGLLAVVVPHALSLHRRLAVKMGIASRPDELGESDRRLGHKHCFTHFEMRRLIEDAGLTVEEQFG